MIKLILGSRIQIAGLVFIDLIKSLYINPKTRWIFEQDKEVISCEDSQFCYAVENDVECKYTITPIRDNFGAKITGLNLG